MSSDSIKPIIFISYAHLDEPDPPGEPRWLSFVMEFLRPGVKGRKYEVWMDRLMPGGADWNPEIEAKIRSCDIFVLLVSTRSTGSDYIVDNEIPIIRERQSHDDGVYFYPLLLDWTPKAGLEQVNDKNLRPRDAKPLSSLTASERSRAMSEAADEIAEVAKTIEERKAAAAGQNQPVSSSFPGPGWLLGPAITNFVVGSFDRFAPATEGARAAPVVDINGLPETGYERLVGREAELGRLNEAWNDDRTNILSLVAEGGAGKSALVNEWLTRLRADGYSGADCVLGWSFYSQGSKERAAAADEFLDWALRKLGVKLETTSPSAKGEAIADALVARRALLVLDGVEPLQHGPGMQAGQLKDRGLRSLLRGFATAAPKADHSLMVLTSRLAVADIQRFKSGAAPVVDVERLSDEAGAELLRDNDVWGIDEELRAASRDLGGHPLALTLLASLIKETQNGDVRRRDHMRGLLADKDNTRHGHARRVMESYEEEWLADPPVLLAILHCVGLFDRPASGDCIRALRAKPAIPGLTDAFINHTDELWRRVVARLRGVRLLSPVDPSDPEALDAHPLVREWFGDRLKRTNEAAWKEAHSRLYEHLRDTTHEGKTPTLADLAPLYHAIAHGCHAGRLENALDQVFRNRIHRRLPNGTLEGYSLFKLGAASTDLAAISWFFERPYEEPNAALKLPDRAWIFAEAGFALRAQGRLQEAVAATRAGLCLFEDTQDWRSAAIEAANLSQTELLIGEIAAAIATAEKAAAYADRSGEEIQRMFRFFERANALYASGDWEKVTALFADRVRRTLEVQPKATVSSLEAFYCSELLLSQGRACAVRDEAMRTLKLNRRDNNRVLVALNTLTLGRANLLLALQLITNRALAKRARADVRAAASSFDGAVEGLRGSGLNQYLPCGLLARAAFRRAVGDWEGAARDLDETEEIAEPGPMRLFLCDVALERARLALAEREGFAPLNGLVETSPSRPVLPDATAAAALVEEARKELDVARNLIAECGYHRRDEELAELDAVMAGAPPLRRPAAPRLRRGFAPVRALRLCENCLRKS